MNNGKYGERLFKNTMEQLGYKVEDTTNNPQYFDKDIDFIITSPFSGKTKSFEVKWDDCINSTGNLYLEIENIYSKGGKGWYEFCQADFLAYGDSRNRTFYIIPLLELQERVKHLPQRIGRCGNESTGLLVRLVDIQDIVEVL